MEILIRPVFDTDWTAILDVVNQALPGSTLENQHWWQKRQEFNLARYTRRHYIARLSSSGDIVAYAAIEEGPDRKQFRLFLVMPPHYLSEAGQPLLLQLFADLDELGAEKVWAWEEASDRLCDLLLTNGFEPRTRFTLPDGRDSLFLAKELRQPSA